MPLLYNRRVILAKIESSYATDPTPTGEANAILVRNLNVIPLELDLAPRELVRPYLGNSEQIPAGSRVRAEFEVEIQGAGAAGDAPAYGPLLRACGFSETLTEDVDAVYALVSTGQASVTIYYNNDGRLHKLTGARGNVVLGFTNKGIPVFRFSFMGLYNAITDTALPTPTYTGFHKPVAVTNDQTTAFALHGYSGVMSELSIDVGNNVVHRDLVGGTKQVLITDRATNGSITIESTLVAAKNWWTTMLAATTGALAIQHGQTAGYIVELDAPAVQLTNPTESEMDGITMLGFNLALVPSTGNDELVITVK